MQDPMKAGYLNMLLQQGLKGASQQGAVQQQNLMQNLAAGGFGGQNLNPFLQSQIGKIGRATSGMKAQDYMNTLLQGANLRMGAASQASGFGPLQPGSTQVQQQSGLGTWLPTVLGAGLNFATGGGLGMLGGMFGGSPMTTQFPTTMNSLNYGPGFGQLPEMGVGSMPSYNAGVPQMPFGAGGPPAPM